jgi:hypothetical protein
MKRNMMGTGQVNEVTKQVGPRLPIRMSKKALLFLVRFIMVSSHVTAHGDFIPLFRPLLWSEIPGWIPGPTTFSE